MDTYTDKDTMVQLLMDIGIGRVNATMIIPYVWLRPATTDPYSPVMTTLVVAIQRRLAAMGIRTRGDGYVDAATDRALSRIVGPRWKNVTWARVLEGVRANASGRSRKENTMSYHLGLGAIEETKWCSDKNPQGQCKPLTGICKPMDVPTADLFKELQRQANRVAYSQGKTALWVDARPGPKTLALVNSIIPGGMATFSHCDELCKNADTVIAMLKAYADAKNVPVAVAEGAKPSPAARSGVDLGPAEPDPTILQAGVIPRFLQSPVGLGLVAVGVIWFLSSRKKKPAKKKPAKKKAKRSRRKARRRVTYTWW